VKSRSLDSQIERAEQQVLNRQQRVNTDTSSLVEKINQDLASPANLIFAGGIGFIMAELTKSRTCNCTGTNSESSAIETSPLRTVVNIISLAHTLYTTLPFIWIRR